MHVWTELARETLTPGDPRQTQIVHEVMWLSDPLNQSQVQSCGICRPDLPVRFEKVSDCEILLELGLDGLNFWCVVTLCFCVNATKVSCC